LRLSFTMIVLLCAGLSACKGGDAATGAAAAASGKPQGGGGKGGRGGALSFAVDVIPVEAKKATYLVTAPGTIEAFERVQVTARVAGAIDRIGFTEGQEVKKGDVLVVIDSERFQVAVNSAKAAVDKATASVDDADAMVKRREGASDKTPGLVTGEELASYRTKAVTAKADREVAIEALHTAQLNLRDSYVRAPIAGVIQTRTVETGQYVQAGYVMATLLRRDPLLLRFQVEPQDAPRLSGGSKVGITMRETQRAFTATITLVSAAADPVTHMVSVTGEVDDTEHRYWLRPGSFCDVNIDLSPDRSSPLIPRLAARATDHGYVAYVVENDVAKERVLALGMSTKDGWVEVRSGLAAGEILVVRGAEALAEGAKVKVTKVTPESLLTNPAASASASAAPAPAPSAAAPEGSGRRRGPAGAASAGAHP
jgi:membrane fusion protein, multidrug efflux system